MKPKILLRNTSKSSKLFLKSCTYIVQPNHCRNHQEPPGTTDEKIWYARKLYESAFHPDSGELQNFCGRMSFQVPGGMLITGFMLQFYRFFFISLIIFHEDLEFRFVFFLS